MAEFNLLDPNGVVIPRAGWVVSADSQASGYPASSAVDGSARLAGANTCHSVTMSSRVVFR